MLSKTVSRKSFLDLLQARGVFARGDLDFTERIRPLSQNSDDIHLIWNQDDLEPSNSRNTISIPALPSIILVPSGKKRDFLAWMWTYLSEFRPLTAYARVLDEEELRLFSHIKRSPGLATVEEACLGLIMGEAATYVENKQEKRTLLTPLACASTCSHAMARLVALSPDGDLFDSDEMVSALWTKARGLTKQRQLRLKLEELALPWRVLLRIHANEEGYRFSSRDVPEPIYSTCLSLYNKSEVDSNTWNRLAPDYPQLLDASREMQGNRERRVVFFEQFLVSLIEKRSSNSAFASFLCGLLASQIGPGTLDYLSLITPSLDQFPTALLWYGLCSGLQRRSSLYGFSSGLGRRVLREILRKETLFDSPRADIALAELEVLTFNDTASAEFRTGAQGGITIEILPLVVTTFRWLPRQADQPDLFPTETTANDIRDLNDLRDVAAQLEDLRTRISRAQQRVSRIIQDRDVSEWRPSKRQNK